MKNVLIIGILAIIAITAVCAQNSKSGGEDIYTTYEGLYELMETRVQGEDFFLIDVRTPAEYESGHIPGSMLIPYESIVSPPPTGKKDALIILYCRSGNRAGTAEKALEQEGYTNVHNFGGYGKWKGPLREGKAP